VLSEWKLLDHRIDVEIPHTLDSNNIQLQKLNLKKIDLVKKHQSSSQIDSEIRRLNAENDNLNNEFKSIKEKKMKFFG